MEFVGQLLKNVLKQINTKLDVRIY